MKIFKKQKFKKKFNLTDNFETNKFYTRLLIDLTKVYNL